MGQEVITKERAESFLDYMSVVTRLTAKGHVRWLLVRWDPPIIVAETIWPMLLFGFATPVPKSIAARLDPDGVVGWELTPQRFLTASDDARDAWYVHTSVPEDSEHVGDLEDLVHHVMKNVAPGARARTRDEQLAEGGRFVQALRAWEAGDDSARADLHVERARAMAAELPERRAKLRWGMLPGIDR